MRWKFLFRSSEKSTKCEKSSIFWSRGNFFRASHPSFDCIRDELFFAVMRAEQTVVIIYDREQIENMSEIYVSWAFSDETIVCMS